MLHPGIATVRGENYKICQSSGAPVEFDRVVPNKYSALPLHQPDRAESHFVRQIEKVVTSLSYLRIK
jgi:hypothetical protein